MKRNEVYRAHKIRNKKGPQTRELDSEILQTTPKREGVEMGVEGEGMVDFVVVRKEKQRKKRQRKEVGRLSQ